MGWTWEWYHGYLIYSCLLLSQEKRGYHCWEGKNYADLTITPCITTFIW